MQDCQLLQGQSFRFAISSGRRSLLSNLCFLLQSPSSSSRSEFPFGRFCRFRVVRFGSDLVISLRRTVRGKDLKLSSALQFTVTKVVYICEKTTDLCTIQIEASTFPLPPGIPRGFEYFSCRGGATLITLVFPGAGHLITTHRGWGI